MNKLFGGLVGSAPCTVQLELRAAASAGAAGQQPTVTVKSRKDESETLPLFATGDTLAGEVKVTPIPGKRADHQGIRVQLLGEVELASERGHPHQFLSLVRDLAPPGELHTQAALPFEFGNVELQYESYRGIQAQVRYLLRVTVSRGMGGSVVKDHPFWVRSTQAAPPPGPPIKMEVGIEDCLHIEFEYERGAYGMGDTVLGRIHFLLVRIKLKHMELEVRRRETAGAGAAARSETETVAKYEIMDGAPARGECIPIRLSLKPYDLSPSYPNVFNKFSVKYFLNLVLVDEEDRRYFKQQEITLYRPAEQDPLLLSREQRLPRRMPALLAPPSESTTPTAADGHGPAAVAALAAASSSSSAAAAATEGHLVPPGAAPEAAAPAAIEAAPAAPAAVEEDKQSPLEPLAAAAPFAAAADPLAGGA